jgi:hypothetical protein
MHEGSSCALLLDEAALSRASVSLRLTRLSFSCHFFFRVRLCGNNNNIQVVSVDEGKQLAKEYGIGFFETSAKNDIEVDTVSTLRL